MRHSLVSAMTLSWAVALAATMAAAADDEHEIKVADSPAAVQKTLHAEAKGARIDTVSKETEAGHTTYWAVVVISGKHYEIAVAEDGTLKEMSMEVDTNEISFSDCPAAVQKTLHVESKGAKIETLGKDVKYGGTIYEATVAIGGKEYQIVVAHDGTLIEKSLIIEEDDVELDKCPAAVQKALHDHAQGGKIGAITRSTGIDGHVYEAELEIDGKDYSVEVNEGGLLIAKWRAEEE